MEQNLKAKTDESSNFSVVVEFVMFKHKGTNIHVYDMYVKSLSFLNAQLKASS